MRIEPVAETSGTRGSAISGSPTVGPSPHDEREDRRVDAELAAHALREPDARDRRQRRFLRRLPDVASPQTAASALFHAQTARES